MFLLLLLRTFDIGQMAYAKAILNGAVEQAARSGTLETANTTTVTVTYQPIFTARSMSNYGATRTLTATGVRKNQPFATQVTYGSSTGTCS